MFESWGSSEETQREHPLQGQRLGKEKLGLVFTSFGAPFNAPDGSTAKGVSRDSGDTVWLFGYGKDAAVKFMAPEIGALNIELPVHKPNLATFQDGPCGAPRGALYRDARAPE